VQELQSPLDGLFKHSQGLIKQYKGRAFEYIGYKEYKQSGITRNLPRMLGFQAEGSAPIVKGHPINNPKTIATAIRIGNPASWKQAEVARDESGGLIDTDKLRAAADDQTAAIMLTNPNTLGLFEEEILEVAEIIHRAGGLLYYDGANFNPLLGITNPAKMGFDVIHLNLHKTFSTPHGCGGPGAGVVGANEKLQPFLPRPIVAKKDDSYYLDYSAKDSIGLLRTFYGNFTVLVRAYAYILRLGKEGLLRVAKNAVINANYIRARLKDCYQLAYEKPCLHEVVFSAQGQKDRGASALDIAKRLIDYNIHPPTIYFPLIVKEALMVEPTETESKQTLDKFIQAMISIDREIDQDLSKVKNAPYNSPIKRADEAQAARYPEVRWREDGV